MSLRSLNARHVGLIGSAAARHAVRGGGGLVFLLMALMFGLSVTHAILMPVEQMLGAAAREGQELSPEQAVEDVLQFARPAVKWAIGGEFEMPRQDPRQAAARMPPKPAADDDESDAAIQRWAAFLIDDQPGLLSAILLFLLFGMPLLIPFIAFNQLSGDVQTRGLRYVLLRTERANIFFGRFIGTAVFAIIVMAIIVTIVTLYLALRIGIYDNAALAAWGFRGFVALAVLVIPYVALCAWLSAGIDSPFLSLVSASLVVGGVRLFAFLASLKWEPAANLKYLLPWGVQNHLLHPDWSLALGAAAACLGYTALFLFIGYRHFESRDL